MPNIKSRQTSGAPVLQLVRSPAVMTEREAEKKIWLFAESRAEGIISLSAHWAESGRAPNVVLSIEREQDDRCTKLRDRVDSALQRTGLSSERRTISAAADSLVPAGPLLRVRTTTIPLVRVSLPINYGPDLMIVAGAALSTLRGERLLFTRRGGRLTQRLRQAIQRLDASIVKNQAMLASQHDLAGVHSLLLLMSVASPGDRMVEIEIESEWTVVVLVSDVIPDVEGLAAAAGDTEPALRA